MNAVAGQMASALPVCNGCGKLAAVCFASDARVRPSFRLLPLSLCIALALPAYARDDEEQNWDLCPIGDALPGFGETPSLADTPEARTEQPTEIEGDQLEDLENEETVVQGNVALSRGDQFLGTDKLTFNRETGDYVAEGSVRYKDSGMRVVAERATGNQERDTHRIEDLQYQLTRRRGNGGAEAIEMQGTKGSLHRLHLLHLRSLAARVGTAGQTHRHRHRGRHGRGAQRHPAHRQGADTARSLVHVSDRRPSPYRSAVSVVFAVGTQWL